MPLQQQSHPQTAKSQCSAVPQDTGIWDKGDYFCDYNAFKNSKATAPGWSLWCIPHTCMYIGITAPPWDLWPLMLTLQGFWVVPPCCVVSSHTFPSCSFTLLARSSWHFPLPRTYHSPMISKHISYSPKLLFHQVLQPLWCSHSSASRPHLVQAKQNSVAKEKGAKTLLMR